MTPQELAALREALLAIKCAKLYARYWTGPFVYVIKECRGVLPGDVLGVAQNIEAVLDLCSSNFREYKLSYQSDFMVQLTDRRQASAGPTASISIELELLFSVHNTLPNFGVLSSETVTINPQTHLFEGLTLQEAEDLLRVAERASKENDCDHGNKYFRMFVRHASPASSDPLQLWNVFVSKAALSAAMFLHAAYVDKVGHHE